jgi:iron complex transport system substrate-binding protein
MDSTYPADAPHTSLSGISPNVEAIAHYRPDLVVVSYAPNGLAANLQKLGITMLLEPAPSNLAGSYAQIDQLGKLTGHAAAAAALVTSMRHKIAALVKETPRPATPLSYYYELDQTYYTATSKTFIGNVLGLFGLKDIADKAPNAASGYPQLSAEYIVKSDPDVIFLADTQCCGQSAKTVAARPGWSKILAVRDKSVVLLNDSFASQWGPQIVNLVTDVHRSLLTIEKRHTT